MHRMVYVALMHTFLMGFGLSAGEHRQQGGGSARVPQRSIQKAPGLISSASHGDFNAVLLQGQVASRDMQASGEDLEDAFSSDTRASSFAEPLTGEQQQEHEFNISAIHAEWLIPSETATAINKVATGDAHKKELASDIKILEPTLKKFFATLPSDKRGNLPAVYLLKLLCAKYRVPEQTLAQEIQNIRQQQSQHRCCVIL